MERPRIYSFPTSILILLIILSIFFGLVLLLIGLVLLKSSFIMGLIFIIIGGALLGNCIYEIVKIVRTKQSEELEGNTLVSEGPVANYQDMLNYAVFALIKLTIEA